MSSKLISNIYSSAIDGSLLLEAIDESAHYVGSTGAAIISVHTDGSKQYDISAMNAFLRNNTSPQITKRWMTEFSHYDAEGHILSQKIPVHQPFADQQLWPDPELDNRPDQIFLQKMFGIRRKLAVRLADNPRFVQNLAFQFTAEMMEVPPQYYEPVKTLSPHFAKSLEMTLVFSQLKSQYDAVLAVLDRVGIGICILRPDGVVVTRNTEAERIFSTSAFATLNSLNRIKLESNEQNAELSSYILASSLSNSMKTVAERILTVRDKDDRHPLVIEVSPLRDQLNELDEKNNLVLLQLIDTGSHEQCSITRFASAYQFTPAESDVARLIVEGLTNNEIADSRGTSVETSKSQVKTIMAKTNVRSRIELIRRILKTDPPIS